jgi:DNA-binding CsgD family transcriptional regulator
MDELKHSGTPQNFAGDPHGSGRYREGSGDRPYQHGAPPFLEQVKELQRSGMSEAEIAKALNMSTTQLRAKKSIANQERIAAEQAQALRLKEHGYSTAKIAEIMGMPERTVYTRLDPTLSERANRTALLAEQLKQQVDEKTYLDVGVGVEFQLGVNNTQLKTAVAMLEEQGYKKHLLRVEQATNPGQKTSVLVLTKDDITTKEVYDNRDKVMSPLGIYSEDNGRTWRNIQDPLSISSDRVQVRFAEDGGKEKDGVIELRRGVEDLSLGQAQYAQVRISVDGTHYLKGMAVYNDNMPKGVDVIFNTNKSSADVDKLGAMKAIKDDPDNPFGSTVRQLTKPTGEYDSQGNEIRKVYSACNIVNDDSDWSKWSNTLSSQFLSKQYNELAKRQLDIAYKAKKQEFDEICQLTNPAVKKSLLLSFSDECDSDAVTLKAAAMPRQRTQVLLPVPSLKDHEVYAPNFKNGEEIILVRHPHGGTFEIPRLVVNNRNPEAKAMIGNAAFAIGINKHVADRLSGADFDGDTVIAIPTRNQKLKVSPALEGLKNFDPQEMYKAYPGMPKVSEKTGFKKQLEMGKVSNLITDMTLKGATQEEIAKAVRHSMVVIDAEKHNLNYKQSYEDNNIAVLKEKYQGGKNRGASTLISKASSEYDVPMRKDFLPTKYTDKLGQGIDPKTGRKIYKNTEETWTDKKGKVRLRMEKSTKMAEASDAYILTSGGSKSNPGTRMEGIYADHANKLKALGNEARKEYISTKPMQYSPSARKTYAKEVASLDSKLKTSILNAPRERQAQLLANYIYKDKKRNNPDMDKDEAKKVKAQTLEEARSRVGAVSRKQRNIVITDREWEAIQAGAISNNKLSQILRNTDEKAIKERATPKNKPAMTAAKVARAKSLLKMGYTQAEVADYLNVSVSTINKQVNGG